MASLTLDSLKNTNIFPVEFSSKVITKAVQDSVVKKLAGDQLALPLTGSSVAVQTSRPEAGVVGEAGMKPVTSFGLSSKILRPIKVAAIITWSEELAKADKLGLEGIIQQQLAGAITRAFDLAVLHGKSTTGQAIPGVEFVNQTTKRVELGTTAQTKGGISGDLIAGIKAVQDARLGYRVNGLAADDSLRLELMGATDTNGRPIYQSSLDLTDSMGKVFGLPTAYGDAVSGQVGTNADTKVRALGGDWSQLVYGFANEITFKYSNEASITDGATTTSLFQTNQEALLCEASFGWAIADTNAFFALEDKVK